MQLTVLGAGSILPREGYGCSGYALRAEEGGPVTLLDCGPGSVRSLAQHGIGLPEVERVVLSHFHPDHCLDLLALAFARRNPHIEVGSIELIGPRGFEAWLQRGVAALDRWVEFQGATVMEVEPHVDPTLAHRAGDLSFSAVRTRHTEHSLAWRVDYGGASLVYSGDSREAEEVARLAQGTSLFLCECAGYDDDPPPGHLTPLGAARLAEAAQARSLVLTHFYPHVDPELACEQARSVYGGEVLAASDGSRFHVSAS